MSVTSRTSHYKPSNPVQYTIFDEIGSMASGMAHIHVAIPLNLSTFSGQAQILQDYLSKLSRVVDEDHENKQLFMQSIREIAKFALTRLNRIKTAITHLDIILPFDGDLTDSRNRRQVHSLDADIYESIDIEHFLDPEVKDPVHIGNIIVSPTILRHNFTTRWHHQLHLLTKLANSTKQLSSRKHRIKRQLSDNELAALLSKTPDTHWPINDVYRRSYNLIIKENRKNIDKLITLFNEITSDTNKLNKENLNLQQHLGLLNTSQQSVQSQLDAQIESILSKNLAGLSETIFPEIRTKRQAFFTDPEFQFHIYNNKSFKNLWLSDLESNKRHSAIRRKRENQQNIHWGQIHRHLWGELYLNDREKQQVSLQIQADHLQILLNDYTVSTLLAMRNFSRAEITHSELSARWAKHSDTQLQGFYTLDEILQSTPKSTMDFEPPRVKRVAPLLVFAAISGVLGTFLGMYNAYEISVLKQRLNEVGKNHNLLVQVTKQQEEQIHKITENMNAICSLIKLMIQHNPALISAQISAQLDLFQSRLQRATNAVQQLQHRRLSVDLLDTSQLEEMHRAIQAVAEQRGYTLLPERLSDYFQLEASYLRQGKDILIMLHVPCILHDQMLTIYRYVPFPYPLPTQVSTDHTTLQERLTNSTADNPKSPEVDSEMGENVDAVLLIPEAEMIAVGKERKYKILSQGDLAACIKRNRVYLCEKHQVLHTDLANSCLGSIFDRNEKGVRDNCKLERKRLRETVYQLSATDHILFTPHPYTTQIICKNGSHFPLYLSQTTKIHIPEECRVSLHSHSIQSDYNIRISPEPLNVPWQWDPLTLPADLLLDAAMIDNKINAIHQNISHLLTETARKTDFQAMMNTQFSSPTSFPWFIWVAIFTSVITFILLIFWYCYNSHQDRRNATPPTTGPSVQLIQMPQLQPQPTCPESPKPGYHLPPQYNYPPNN